MATLAASGAVQPACWPADRVCQGQSGQKGRQVVQQAALRAVGAGAPATAHAKRCRTAAADILQAWQGLLTLEYARQCGRWSHCVTLGRRWRCRQARSARHCLAECPEAPRGRRRRCIGRRFETFCNAKSALHSVGGVGNGMLAAAADVEHHCREMARPGRRQGACRGAASHAGQVGRAGLVPAIALCSPAPSLSPALAHFQQDFDCSFPERPDLPRASCCTGSPSSSQASGDREKTAGRGTRWSSRQQRRPAPATDRRGSIWR